MRKVIKSLDLFPAAPILRAEQQVQVRNSCGSFISVIIIGFFVYIFTDNIFSMVKLQRITADQMVQMNSSEFLHIDNVNMAIGLQFFNLTQLRNIFQVRAFIVDKTFLYKEIPIYPCKRYMWDMITDLKYNTMRLDTHMCIDRSSADIYGEQGSPQYHSLFFNLSICNPATSPVPCASNDIINNFLSTRQLKGRFFGCSVIALDVNLNPTNQNPIQYTVYEKTLWLFFNNQQQVLTQMFLGTFQINTDVNFLPFKSPEQQKGYFISEAVISTIINTQSLPLFVECYAIVSPINKVINRTYGKFDEVLSYVGGLYGIVISFFAFFLMSFNQYKYELRVSEGAFSFRDAHLAKESDLHFGKYLKYVVYDWVKTLLCCQLEWEDCKAIDAAREEAVEQIDVKHLLRRISHLEKIISVFVKTEDETVLYLAELNSIEDVRRKRRIVEYCEKFSEADKNMTIQTFEIVNAIFQMGINEDTKSQSFYRSKYSQKQNLSASNLTQKQIFYQNKSSLQIMQQFVNQFRKKFQKQYIQYEPQLLEEQQNIQKQIAQSFYNLSQQTRMKIIKKIPLGVLSRLSNHNPKKQNTSKIVPMNYEYEGLSKQFTLRQLRIDSDFNGISGKINRTKYKNQFQFSSGQKLPKKVKFISGRSNMVSNLYNSYDQMS